MPFELGAASHGDRVDAAHRIASVLDRIGPAPVSSGPPYERHGHAPKDPSVVATACTATAGSSDPTEGGDGSR